MWYQFSTIQGETQQILSTVLSLLRLEKRVREV